jgi:hypothetical protein
MNDINVICGYSDARKRNDTNVTFSYSDADWAGSFYRRLTISFYMFVAKI